MILNNISKYEKCAYCGACVNICPLNAIGVDRTSAFYQLKVDEKKCINCGKCLNVCPINVPKETQHLFSAYAAYSTDEKIVLDSSSGGVFNVIAQGILENNGIVFGAAYSADNHKIEFSDTDTVPLKALQKSKYVESDVGDCFKKIKQQLDDNRLVMFCGTPCQASGLKRFLGKEYNNLLVCDFSCGGLPSHTIYNRYLNELEKKYKSKAALVDFRPKNYGWEHHSIFIRFSNGREYTKLAMLDPYFKAFLYSLSKRDYCYKCDFADNHASDIILADLWKYNLCSFENKHTGISLVITNSEKGEEAVNSLSKRLVLQKLPLDEASYNIKKAYRTDNVIEKHKIFMKSENEVGLSSAVRMVEPSNIIKDWKLWVRQVLKKKKYD